MTVFSMHWPKLFQYSDLNWVIYMLQYLHITYITNLLLLYICFYNLYITYILMLYYLYITSVGLYICGQALKLFGI